jgi:hypothetical protein
MRALLLRLRVLLLSALIGALGGQGERPQSRKGQQPSELFFHGFLLWRRRGLPARPSCETPMQTPCGGTSRRLAFGGMDLQKFEIENEIFSDFKREGRAEERDR